MADKPTYMELLQALRNAPPWQAIGDERYRLWDVNERQPLLDRAPAPK